MCVICIQWEKGKLTSKEAFKNIGELIYTIEDDEYKNHLFELSDRILDKDLAHVAVDPELDEAWQRETDGN